MPWPFVTTAIAVNVAVVVATANISLHDETLHRQSKRAREREKHMIHSFIHSLACNDYWFSVSEIHTLRE